MNLDTIWMTAFYLFVIGISSWLGNALNNTIIKIVKKKHSRIMCSVLIKIAVFSIIVSTIAKSLSYQVRLEEKMLTLNNTYYLFNIVGIIAIVTMLIIFCWSIKSNK